MDIRSSLEGLRSILGVGQAAPQVPQARPGSTAGSTDWHTDRATLSNAASEVSQTASEPEVRMDKVASIQAQLAAGTYDVPASAVASKMVEAMLGGGR